MVTLQLVGRPFIPHCFFIFIFCSPHSMLQNLEQPIIDGHYSAVILKLFTKLCFFFLMKCRNVVLLPCSETKNCAVEMFNGHPSDAQRALLLLEEYRTKLNNTEDRQLRHSIQRVIDIFQSNLFQALIGTSDSKFFHSVHSHF